VTVHLAGVVVLYLAGVVVLRIVGVAVPHLAGCVALCLVGHAVPPAGRAALQPVGLEARLSAGHAARHLVGGRGKCARAPLLGVVLALRSLPRLVMEISVDYPHCHALPLASVVPFRRRRRPPADCRLALPLTDISRRRLLGAESVALPHTGMRPVLLLPGASIRLLPGVYPIRLLPGV
jgi:hypothetical protein